MKSVLMLSILALSAVQPATAVPADTLRHRLGWEAAVVPGWTLAADHYEKKWLKGKGCTALQAAVTYTPLPCDSDSYAADYGYPTFSAGLQYGLNHGVTMHRDADPDWGLLQPVDYTSRMGNTVTLYGAFTRPLLRTRHWEAAYTLAFGVGYTASKYNTTDAIDNELIGSHGLIFFGSGLHATYRLARRWALRGGIAFYHHSNGALNRPNKGANVLAPSLALVYRPHYDELPLSGHRQPTAPFQRCWVAEVAVSIGAKTLNEDWQLTQFGTPPGEPGYRTSRFKLYPTCAVQTGLLRRYARRWASGVGVDLFYGSYADRVARLDRARGIDVPHSRWSAGISVKHRVYYHQLSLAMSAGYYLFRQMGDNARQVETPYYEHIGVDYTFPALNGITLGIHVKAHRTKADYTELVIARSFKL